MIPDRRSICRECGRGNDAPHKNDCETGRLRKAYEEFNLAATIRRLHDDT